ncbi:MAG TPA: FAD-binding oxidoreductase [Candidatus Kapabacteria bacterium]|nr:FAD-binding oxidoreductase [Candidatus Kapabacteria bacterium]
MQWYQAEVVDIVKEAFNVRRFYLRFNDLETYDFEAGQHVKIEFPIPAKKNYREYSIASAPNGSNIIELLIVLDPNGVATTYLFNEIHIGSFLKTSEPRGNFMLKNEITTDLYMICTGTGLAPLRSIYLDIFNKNIPHKNIHLIFGTRFMRDMTYLDEMEELSKVDSFHFHPVLSRETSPEWNGHRGYVHKVYQELLASKPDAEFYICGWKEMVSEARTNLLNMGYSRKMIHFERYD